MAYSTQRAVSDGSLNLLDISLDYFDRADISVYFDNIVQTTGWNWVGATEKKISFTPNVPAGVEVLVVRTSDLEEIRHKYSGGAQFTAETLDENMQQLLHIAQEARENANIEDVYRDLNMHGYKLTNVGPGVASTDAMTVGQAQSFVDQAEDAATLAEQWASSNIVVAGGKYSAKHYAEAAEAAAASIDHAELLTKSGNLAGLTNQSTARGNLGLGTAAAANTSDFQAAMPSATQAEMEAGTESALRAMSPLRVKQAIVALSGGGTPSMVRLNTTNGYGSTNTKIRRFTNVVTNQGTDITYTDSATLGASFTINTAGVYAISYGDQFSGSAAMGLSLNTTAPASHVGTIPTAEVIQWLDTSQANYPGVVSATLFLPAGSVIRAHTDGGSTGSNTSAGQFIICRVG